MSLLVQGSEDLSPVCFGVQSLSSCGKKTEEDTQYTCEPLGDLRYLFRTTNECHSNEHPQNVVSGDKISQENSKEPAQLGRDCIPKQAGNKSSDP